MLENGTPPRTANAPAVRAEDEEDDLRRRDGPHAPRSGVHVSRADL